MQPITGVVQHYAWGDVEFIPRLLGVEPDGRPWAELWLGTHPNGPSTLADGRPLADITGDLPYLLKVLACTEPLSMQVHPDASQARDGYGRGVFADPRPKPELICALTRFDALCGVRPVDATLALLTELGAEQLAAALASDGPDGVVDGIYGGRFDLAAVVDACASSSLPEARFALQLDARYPGDPSVVVALLLNRVVLEPGEALRLGPGQLHSYLNGAGIELMGNSDNVVRAGLTAKPVDVEELLAIVDARPLADPVLPVSDRHELPAAGVALVRIEPGASHVAVGHELVIDLAGRAWHLAPGDVFEPSHASFAVVACERAG